MSCPVRVSVSVLLRHRLYDILSASLASGLAGPG